MTFPIRRGPQMNILKRVTQARILIAIVALTFISLCFIVKQKNLVNDDVRSGESLALGCKKKETLKNETIKVEVDYDQLRFKQPLKAECKYYDDDNGLFAPDTPFPRYIVTGGAGFVGSHLVKGLIAKNVLPSQIKILDNLSRGRLANLQYDDDTWAVNPADDLCSLDLKNKEDAFRYIRGADYIYHLADIVAGVAYVFSHQESVFHENLLINTYTLRAAKHNGIKNYIYVGTACSFPKGLQMGPGIHALTEDQTYPAEPESAYGWSKLMGEYEAELAKEPGVFNVGLLRFHNVYGPRSDYSPTSGQAIPSLIRKAFNYPNEDFIVWGSGQQYRDFVYIDDIVRALLLVKDKGMNEGVIQVGSAKATTIAQLAKEVTSLVGKRRGIDIPIHFDPCQPEGDRGRIAAGNRAKQILGWETKVSLTEGLSASINWMERQQKQSSVLFILIGQARGSEYAWKSFLDSAIKPYKAHLATFFTSSSPQTILQKKSQFRWTIPETDDWSEYFNQAASLCHQGRNATDWRKYCDIKNQWLGGVKDCDHPASAGILLAFRWLVAQKILSLNLLNQYDYFVLSRADYVYLCDHYPFHLLNGTGYVPYGEEYNGYTDRHLVGQGTFFFKMINITQQLVCDVDRFYPVQAQLHPNVNLEITQRQMWTELGIPIKQFDTSFFTVKLPDDPTKWSPGADHEIVSKFDHLKVKYPGELEKALAHCKFDHPALEQRMQYLKDLPLE